MAALVCCGGTGDEGAIGGGDGREIGFDVGGGEHLVGATATRLGWSSNCGGLWSAAAAAATAALSSAGGIGEAVLVGGTADLAIEAAWIGTGARRELVEGKVWQDFVEDWYRYCRCEMSCGGYCEDKGNESRGSGLNEHDC